MIELADLEGQHDFAESHRMVEEVIGRIAADPLERVRVMGHYASWNGFFGSGVASLAGRIGRARRTFLDPAEPIEAVADRSVLVASYFFDAARDEFDDRGTAKRDTHRCLAQAFIAGLIAHGKTEAGGARLSDPAEVNALLAEPDWLRDLNRRVAEGYGAVGGEDAHGSFRAMGYHLGSEILADAEFSVMDAALAAQAPELVTYLKSAKIEIAGETHVPYAWIRIHSGHGGGAEADHFDWAAEGVRRAFDYSPPAIHEILREAVLDGFRQFASDHDAFFAQV